MEYIEQSNQYNIQYNGGVFALSANDENLVPTINELLEDESKLEYFISLLNQDFMTAWNIYHGIQILPPEEE